MQRVTRVRYKLEGNKYVSTKEFLANEGMLLRVVIDVPTSTVDLMEGDRLVSSKACTSVAEAKASVKSVLKEVGVGFFEETRGKKLV